MFKSCFSAILLLAVLLGPNGEHGIVHDLVEDYTHAGHGMAAEKDCAVCALANSHFEAPEATSVAIPQTLVVASYLLLAYQWIESTPNDTRFERGPPLLLS